MMRKKVRIRDIKYSDEWYARAGVNIELIERYQRVAEREGIKVFPPLLVTEDLKLIDGTHRLLAFSNCAGVDAEVEVEVDPSVKTPEDIVKRSVDINTRHGYPLTQKDIQHITEKWNAPAWIRKIAEIYNCIISDPEMQELDKELETVSQAREEEEKFSSAPKQSGVTELASAEQAEKRSLSERSQEKQEKKDKPLPPPQDSRPEQKSETVPQKLKQPVSHSLPPKVEKKEKVELDEQPAVLFPAAESRSGFSPSRSGSKLVPYLHSLKIHGMLTTPAVAVLSLLTEEEQLRITREHARAAKKYIYCISRAVGDAACEVIKKAREEERDPVTALIEFVERIEEGLSRRRRYEDEQETAEGEGAKSKGGELDGYIAQFTRKKFTHSNGRLKFDYRSEIDLLKQQMYRIRERVLRFEDEKDRWNYAEWALAMWLEVLVLTDKEKGSLLASVVREALQRERELDAVNLREKLVTIL